MLYLLNTTRVHFNVFCLVSQLPETTRLKYPGKLNMTQLNPPQNEIM